LFVHDSCASNLLPQYLEKSGIRIIRNLIVHHHADIPARVLRARTIGAADDLIADARFVEGCLVLLSCSGKTYEIELSNISALSKAPENTVRNFEVERDGSYVYWPGLDVHLDMGTVHNLCDPSYEERANHDRIQSDELFGKAIAKVRQMHHLRQSDVRGLSERQVRRIEFGSRPRVSSLNLLAKAHHLSPNQYLDEVAREIQGLR
jgi:hypothetical protein